MGEQHTAWLLSAAARQLQEQAQRAAGLGIHARHWRGGTAELVRADIAEVMAQLYTLTSELEEVAHAAWIHDRTIEQVQAALTGGSP